MSVKRPDPIDIHVGTRIRALRLGKNLSQTALANQLGVTFQQVQKYEKGVNRVGAGRLVKIAETLGCAVPDFFAGLESGANGTSKASTDPCLQLSQVWGGVSLAAAYLKIEDRAMQRAIVALVEAAAAPGGSALRQAA